METTIEALAHIFSSLPLQPDQPWGFHTWPPVVWYSHPPPPLLLRSENNKSPLQQHSRSDLLASPYLNHNKAEILKPSPTPSLRPRHKAPISYLQMVMARVHRTPEKDGKNSKKMKNVIICEARQALLGGWKFIIRLIWRERNSQLPSAAREAGQRDPTWALAS